MKRALNSFRECLFDAFANIGYSDPQALRQLWAIREGLRRVDPGGYHWREVQARKEHDCMRGHEIHRGETYFQYQIGAGWGNDWKFCAGCMAMILYFQQVDQLGAVWFTHWDRETEGPVRVTEG